MKRTVFLYGAPGRGYDPAQQGQPIYYQQVPPAYYPYPYYYGPPVNPYEAARQGEGADQIAKIIWWLVAVVVVCAVVGVIALMFIAG
jgi:hypothetical protein